MNCISAGKMTSVVERVLAVSGFVRTMRPAVRCSVETGDAASCQTFVSINVSVSMPPDNG